ncbi:response regulator [bacterium]|nr:response regulator [bacterium]
MQNNDKLKILVVDDQPGMCETLVDIIEDAGYFIDSAENGIIAIEKTKASKFDLILMDIIMPGKNGVETLKEIKKFHPQAIVILMTAYTAPDLIMEAQKAGVYECLGKPFSPGRLLKIIERLDKEKESNLKKNKKVCQ